jgi:hypothetical protein
MFSSKAIQVEIFSSFSPCEKCCELVTNFAKIHPGCSVYIAFTCVYRPGEEAHCAALRKLHLNGVLRRLDVFRAADWRLLESRRFLSLSPYAWRNMREWDFFWRDRLMAILNPIRQVRLKSLFWLPSPQILLSFKKLTVVQLVKFPARYRTLGSITIFP